MISHKLVKRGYSVKYSIVVKCPWCKREGNLHRSRNKFVVSHDSKNTDTCAFGYCSKYYDELKELYSKYRSNNSEK